MTASAPHVEQMGPFLRITLLLIPTNVLIARAVFVPSPSVWTAAVSAAAAVPVVASAGFSPALWAVCAVVVATLTSRVIYGLREEVREARRLGQYTLEEKVGEGGMGAVYRASHAMLRRPTAVKLLPPEKAGEAALERFEREVQLTARLSHPNTVAVFDYGRTPDGIFYYAMEYLDGTNLEELVREDGPQPVGYYLLTGRHVFSGATLVEVCSHHLHTRPEPPSTRLGRPVPPALEGILLACLEKDPARRPASAHALREGRRARPAEGPR